MIIKTQDKKGFVVLGKSAEIYIRSKDFYRAGGPNREEMICFSRGANEEFWLGSYQSEKLAMLVIENITTMYSSGCKVYQMPPKNIPTRGKGATE